MKKQRLIASLFLFAAWASTDSRAEEPGLRPASTTNQSAATEAATLPSVVVTATHLAQSSVDLPLSIDLIDRAAIEQGNAMVNLSESLVRVPGIVAQNRQNYAQDLQISSRGFGARSTFGVRGIRLYADGIPATMPDGQGQTSNVDLGSASRIEVLRGPFSALYGNSSGGVIAVFTENGKPGLMLSSFMQAGSDGFKHAGLKASGQQGNTSFVASISRMETDGYRDHSAAMRDTANAKVQVTLDADSSFTLTGNAVNMNGVQDPMGLSRAQFESNPRGVDPSALVFNTRKSITQQQAGLAYEKNLDQHNTLNAALYGGDRSAIQFQSIPQSAQLPPSSAGGVIDLGRRYTGGDIRWSHSQAMGSGSLQWTAGISYDGLDEDRRGYENFSGTTLGVQGNLRRDEKNNSNSLDEYFQAEWTPDLRWILLAGIRNSSVKVRSADHYIKTGNGDDSGSVQYQATNPVFGATFKLSDSINVYASYGKGFETPTLNELSYRPGATAASGFNFALQPSTSNNLEFGAKAVIGKTVRVNWVVFHIDTDNELAVLSNSGGRSVYQNAGKTHRDGMELSVQGNWQNGFGALLSYSFLRAAYAEAFCSGVCAPATLVAAGNRIPGVPMQTFFGELSWRHAATGFDAALEGKYAGSVAVNDINSDATPAYLVANLRAGFVQTTGHWRVNEFVRIDNIANRRAIGSVIVNEANKRFFEPAPGRTFLAGVSAGYNW